jgi:anaerobic selenocysteine-containing dehydrogenase
MVKISRRNFLKFSFSSAALAGLSGPLSGCFSPAPEAPRQDIRTLSPVITIPSTCQLCPAGCGILGEVVDGRLVKIRGNPKHPNNHGKICARGYAGINLLYDPDRLLYPLKRTGARGEGKWTRISWAEALQEISSKLKKLKETGQIESFWIELGQAHSPELLVLNFLKALGKPTLFSEAGGIDPNKSFAQSATFGTAGLFYDVAKARYILNFGANPYEDGPQYIYLAQGLIEARMTNAARLITFDVRLSQTGGRSNEWIPLKPGTDGIVALAMAQSIIEQGLHDQEFLARWTNFPLPKLQEYLASYTPEKAEKISGVRAKDIRRLAKEFAQTKPAVAISGRGVSGHQNGFHNERCLILLNAVVGNIDSPGGYCLPRTMLLGEPPIQNLFSSSAQAFAALGQGQVRPQIYFSYLANPAYTNPNSAEISRLLRDEKLIPFIVVAETHLTETGALADLLLPVASYLESWNLETRPAMNLIPYVSIRQPVVPPLGNSQSIGDIFLQLAKQMGGQIAQEFPYQNNGEFIAKTAARLPALAQVGGWASLQKDGVWFDASAKPSYRLFEKKGWTTPSGKIEIFLSKLPQKDIPPLPSYVPISAHENLKEGELILTVHKNNVLTWRLANAKWIAEIIHETPLWINPLTAQSLGLRNGERVKVSSAVGSFVVKIRFSQGVHPQIVALTEGLGHWALGHIAQAKKVKTNDFDTDLLWWEKEGNGVNPNKIIPLNFDPVGGGVGWNDTKVTLTKI